MPSKVRCDKQENILSFLKDKRIFSIVKSKDKVILKEECDKYFKVVLTQEQLKKLIEELSQFLKKNTTNMMIPSEQKVIDILKPKQIEDVNFYFYNKGVS